MSTAGLDRRTRRRQETIEEILDVAIDLMETEGVAALSLSAVARQLGMQPPSLYQYFPSKMAIYDALFQRGAERLRDAHRAALATRARTADPFASAPDRDHARSAGGAWRTRSTRSCCSGGRSPASSRARRRSHRPRSRSHDLRDHLQAAVDAGRLHPDATSDEGLALFTSMTAGLLSQQMANEPDASFEDGRFSRLLPVVLEMFYQRYAPTRGKR